MIGCSALTIASTYGFVLCSTIWYQEYEQMSALGNAIHFLPCNIMGMGAAVSLNTRCDQSKWLMM